MKLMAPGQDLLAIPQLLLSQTLIFEPRDWGRREGKGRGENARPPLSSSVAALEAKTQLVEEGRICGIFGNSFLKAGAEFLVRVLGHDSVDYR